LRRKRLDDVRWLGHQRQATGRAHHPFPGSNQHQHAIRRASIDFSGIFLHKPALPLVEIRELAEHLDAQLGQFGEIGVDGAAGTIVEHSRMWTWGKTYSGLWPRPEEVEDEPMSGGGTASDRRTKPWALLS
jgi:hypothetical protein